MTWFPGTAIGPLLISNMGDSLKTCCSSLGPDHGRYLLCLLGKHVSTFDHVTESPRNGFLGKYHAELEGGVLGIFCVWFLGRGDDES